MAAYSNRWAVVVCALLSASAVLANIERVRRITYVMHPGPPGIYPQQPVLLSRSNVVVSSTQERSRRMSRVGSNPAPVQRQQLPAGDQPVAAAVSTQSRHYSFSRSSGQQDAPRSPSLQHKLQMQGVNVCGGKCCHGWSKSSGSERCTKPNCSPPCQNGGMCLRPHLCVCKPGTKGKVCEERATQDTSSGTQSQGAGAPAPPMRPIPQQAAPQSMPKKVQASPESTQGQGILALRQKPHVVVAQPQMVPPQTLTMNLQHGRTQQFMIKPKYFSNSKKVLLGEQSTEGSLPLRANGLDHLTSQLHHMGNQTGRIKVVFTPSICKVTCTKGRCHNNCEKGNTTTLISENGHAADTLTSSNFRVVICHLPCMNGGQCTARDKCHCPPNYTGKLCHIPVQNGNGQKQYQQQQNSIKTSGSHVIHSTHTLPLTVTGQQGIKVNFPPNMVNIHVKHPPEASVQFHQVSRVESSSSTQKKESQIGQTHVSYHGVQKHQLPHAVYPHQQTVSNVYPVSAKSQLGRCFQETTNTQCGKPLPGLSKQEECCGTVGTSWGLGKCMKCPKKASHPSSSHHMECPQGYKRINATFCQGRPSSSHHMDCPQGYKRINATFCQDINECYMQGVCPNGECLNTVGSFRCTCKQGFVPDPTYSSCVAENPLMAEEKGPCFRLVSIGKQCMHPLSVQLSRQLCCCSVGKAWGPHCEKCPVLGTPAFKQICPGGMGYTVPVLRGPHPPRTYTVQPPIRTTLQPIITREEPVEALSVSQGNDAELNGRDDAAPTTDQDPDDQGQLQVSPGISTIKLDAQYPVVYEKSSPPVPVEIAPDVSKSSESQVIAPTQVTEVNECIVDPDICGEGYCVNLPVGYLCVCHKGYKRNENQTKCIDINECEEDRSLCPNGHCENTDGSYLCICSAGYMANREGTGCVDVNECLKPDVCPDGLCINTIGSFRCRYCDTGFRMNRRGQCEDIDECLVPTTCPYDRCMNNPGSFVCVPCPDGYRGSNGRCYDIDECQEDTALCANGDCSNLEGSYMCTCRTGYESTSDSKQCIDIDECQLGDLCLNGNCQNIEGSFLCSCNQGYQLSPARDRCDDIDECQDPSLCGHGQCRNTRGSFTCICNDGYKLSAAGDLCEDIDECQELDEACQGGGSCYNTDGSYTCVCPDGFLLIDGRRCQDINECNNPELCFPNGECLNTAGSFHCICDQGFTTTPDGRSCEDVDECTNSTLCSQGFCENTNGSYRCLCYQGYQDSLDGQGCVDVNECEMLSGVCGEARCENVDGSFLCLCADDNQEYDPMTGHCKYRNMPDHYDDEVKQCYYNLNNVNFCENVLTVNVSKQDCCCTLGAAWGDTCEMFPCPVLGSDEFAVLCPEGKGYVPSKESLYEGNGLTYQDADECMLFGAEICKNGFCLNTEASFECYCKQGTYYDPVKLQCFDNNECDDPSSCIDGECMNTDGSYSCFCTRPMVLDSTGKRCIRPQELVEPTEETDVYQDLCWENLSKDYVCSRPLLGRQTTYTECCCLYGVAWGMQCALCPMEGSEDHALLCNLKEPGYRRPYGEDALEFRDYSIHPDPYSLQEHEENDKYEELQAEECGILNGCENGRCVRVQEGYTCDCFDGYHLDIMKMTCVDVNECNELNSRMSLCKNAKCINTEGSYKCVCLPGYRPSDKPNYCTAINSERDDSELE